MPGVELDDLLAAVQEQTGIDFRQYRRDTVERRLQMRMRAAGAASYLEYRQLLHDDPFEGDRLIAQLTIKVSHFYRNPEVFGLLKEHVFPELIRLDGGAPLALWSAGCGRGEEAYSLAMLLAESVSAHPSLPLLTQSVVLATDVDQQALLFAETGRYGGSAVDEVPPELLQRYFTRTGPKMPAYSVQPRLSRHIQWLRHDLTTGLPPQEGKYHLITCRNVVIYLDRFTQERVQHLLTNCLMPGGYLCLGEAEALLPSVRQAFDVVDHRARIYRRKRVLGAHEPHAMG